MIRPAQRVKRDGTPGLWEGTTGPIVEIDGEEVITAPATTLKFTNDSFPGPEEGAANVGGIDSLGTTNEFVPQLLATPDVDADVVGVLPGDRDTLGLPETLGRSDASVRKASYQEITGRPVDVVVEREGDVQRLSGSITHLDDDREMSRTDEKTGRSVGYESAYLLALEGGHFQESDAGAPVVLRPEEDSVAVAGVILVTEENSPKALITRIDFLLFQLAADAELTSS